MQAELQQVHDELVEDGDDWGAAPPTQAAPPPLPPGPAPRRPHRPRPAAPQPTVLVMGGRPRHAVPRDPKQLRPLKPRRPKALPQQGYNHYADGAGAWGAEDVGLDADIMGVGGGWEGVGTTTF
jgi:hypothetical protein